MGCVRSMCATSQSDHPFHCIELKQTYLSTHLTNCYKVTLGNRRELDGAYENPIHPLCGVHFGSCTLQDHEATRRSTHSRERILDKCVHYGQRSQLCSTIHGSLRDASAFRSHSRSHSLSVTSPRSHSHRSHYLPAAFLLPVTLSLLLPPVMWLPLSPIPSEQHVAVSKLTRNIIMYLLRLGLPPRPSHHISTMLSDQPIVSPLHG